jgi:hypothetical protein
MAVSAQIVMKCSVTEDLADVSLGDASVKHNQFDSSRTITADTVVPATKVSCNVVALSAGAKTLDLTALVGTNGVALTALGLKLQVWKLKNLGANAMTFAEGATDGYAALGAAFSFILGPGQEAQFYLADTAPDVASGDKSIDVTGTGTQTFQNTMVFG